MNPFELKQQAKKKNRKADLTWMDFPIGGFFLYIYGDPCMVDCFMGKVGRYGKFYHFPWESVDSNRWTQLGQHLLRRTKFARHET